MLWSKAPFDESARGDCILQSSDQVHFKTHHLVLSLASPVFDDMFSMPQPSPPIPLPIIPLDEDKETLYLLLTHIHPPRPRSSSDDDENLDTAIKFLVACNKYFIERPEEALSKVVYSEKLLSEDPARFFALSWMAGLEERVKHASRFTHTLDLEDPVTRSKLTLNGRELEPLLALYEFRRKRELALDNLLDTMPLSEFLCSSQKNLKSILKASTYLRRNLRSAVRSPYPLASGTEEFLKRIDGPLLHEIDANLRHRDACLQCPGVKLNRFDVHELSAFEKRVAGFPCQIEWYTC